MRTLFVQIHPCATFALLHFFYSKVFLEITSDILTRTNYITAALRREWRQITTTTTTPPVVGEHGLAYDSARQVAVLYGGNADGWPYEDTTWEFDGTDWLTITTSTHPNARYGAALAYDDVRGSVILFGGSDETDTALNQTWVYTNAAWSQVEVTGPASRTYASLVAGPDGQLYLFGGNDADAYFNDLWRYDNGTWTEIEVSGSRPPARTLAAMTFQLSNPPTSSLLLLFGGRTVTGTLLADLWAFDLATGTWAELDDGGGGDGPPARMAHSLTYDEAAGRVVLVGGVGDEGETVLADAWLYSQGGWTEAEAATAAAYHQAVYGDNAIILVSNGEVWRYE